MAGSRWTCFVVTVLGTLVLSNHKHKSALKCTVWSQCTPVPDRQTDRWTDGQTDGWTLWQ